MDSAIHLLNNWGLISVHVVEILRLPDSEYQSRVIFTVKRESHVVLQASFLLKGGRLDMRAVSVSQSHRILEEMKN